MKRTQVAVVAVALVISTLAVAQAQSTASITLTPSSAEVGDSVTVTGSGFEGTGQVSIFLDTIGGTLLARTPIANRDGDLEPVSFVVPNVKTGGHTIIACRYFQTANECREAPAASKFTVLEPPPPTTTTLPTTTTQPGATTTVPTETSTTQLDEALPTTTSSLVLGVTTTIGGDPPPPSNPTGVAFTTTSTSLDLPSGFADQNVTHFPDIEITNVEVTQGIQDLQNRMPLVAGRRTIVRVYVAADRAEGDGIGGVAAETPEQEETIGPEGWDEVDGLLHLRRGGQDEIVYPVNAPITAYRRGSDRLNGNETLNFEIPDGWADGDVEMTVLVWSFQPETILTSEPDAGNNFAQGSLFFHEANAPQVIWFRLSTASGGLSPDQYDLAMATSTESYMTYHPVAVPNFLQIFATLGPGTMLGDAEPSEEFDFVADSTEPLNRMRFLHAQWGLEGLERMHGLIPGGTPSDNAGLTNWNSLTAWSKPGSRTPAHEGAHMYFIKHAPCKDDDGDGQPDEVDGGGWGWIDQTHPSGLPSCSIAPEDPEGYYGVSANPEAILDIYSNDPSDSSVRFPFMGYQGQFWIDAYHYCLLMEYYEVPCNPGSIGLDPKQAPGAPVNCGPAQGSTLDLDLCLWNGTGPVDQQGGPEGSVQLILAEAAPSGYLLVDVDVETGVLGHAEFLEPSQQSQSEFDFIVARVKDGDMNNATMLRVNDADGNTLARIPVSSRVAGHSATDAVAGSVEMIPWFPTAAALDLIQDGEVVDTRRPGAAPQVEIDPFDPAGEREFRFSWTASDPDGDDLLYSVFWSRDGGATWRIVDTQLTEPHANIFDDLVLPGGEILIKVTASDGLGSGSAIAGPFEIASGTPRGVIVAPESVPQHSPQRLTFQAGDPEDGQIETGTWSSDIDGVMGEGRTAWTRDLSLGMHQITVDIADSDGNELTLSTTLEVVEGNLQPPRPEGSEPMAETMVRLGPGSLDQVALDSGGETTTTTDAVVEASGEGEATASYLGWLIGAAVVVLGTLGMSYRRRSGSSVNDSGTE